MIRLIVENILLFLAPTLIYVAFTMLRRGDAKDNTFSAALNRAPLAVLFTIGFVLMISVLAYYGDKTQKGKPGQKYVPPQVVDGKLVPGHFE
jgi:hypothetical protein